MGIFSASQRCLLTGASTVCTQTARRMGRMLFCTSPHSPKVWGSGRNSQASQVVFPEKIAKAWSQWYNWLIIYFVFSATGFGGAKWVDSRLLIFSACKCVNIFSHVQQSLFGLNQDTKLKVPLRSNCWYSFFYIFVYNMTFLYILPNFNPLRALEVIFF